MSTNLTSVSCTGAWWLDLIVNSIINASVLFTVPVFTFLCMIIFGMLAELLFNVALADIEHQHEGWATGHLTSPRRSSARQKSKGYKVERATRA